MRLAAPPARRSRSAHSPPSPPTRRPRAARRRAARRELPVSPPAAGWGGARRAVPGAPGAAARGPDPGVPPALAPPAPRPADRPLHRQPAKQRDRQLPIARQPLHQVGRQLLNRDDGRREGVEAERHRASRLREDERRGDALFSVLPRLFAQISIQVFVAAVEGLSVMRLFKRADVFRDQFEGQSQPRLLTIVFDRLLEARPRFGR